MPNISTTTSNAHVVDAGNGNDVLIGSNPTEINIPTILGNQKRISVTEPNK